MKRMVEGEGCERQVIKEWSRVEGGKDRWKVEGMRGSGVLG